MCLWTEDDLRLKPGIVLNGFQALVHGDACKKFDPLAGVPHEGKSELGIADVCQATELLLEGWRNGVGAWAGVGRNEVARRANPFGLDVGDVIELAAFGRRQNVPGLEDWVQDRLCSCNGFVL